MGIFLNASVKNVWHRRIEVKGMDDKTFLNRHKYIWGAALSVLGGAMWGISGTCGQFLFTRKGLSSLWLGAPFTLWDLAGFICVFVMLFLLSMKGNGEKVVLKHQFDRDSSTDNMEETWKRGIGCAEKDSSY